MEFTILTAVISGDRTVELRVFSPCAVSIPAEQRLTRRFCRLMDRDQLQLRRYSEAFV